MWELVRKFCYTEGGESMRKIAEHLHSQEDRDVKRYGRRGSGSLLEEFIESKVGQGELVRLDGRRKGKDFNFSSLESLLGQIERQLKDVT